MPLISIPGAEAIQGRRKNHLATWGNRAVENRVEPIARPAFDVPFKLKKKERIFTIGSCFARHVEDELQKLGYRIPMRELFESPPFKDLGTEIVNNFGTPSIYNELAWAFGEETFDESLGFTEVANDKFVDLHVVNSVRPAPLDLVKERRAALREAIRQIAKCRVVIVTLGLAELWWDDHAQCYLNTGPLPSLIAKHPDRFHLHVLGYDECYDYLRRAVDLIFRHGSRATRIILTVSPVPMTATHRQADVITANTYSKSVLRSAAEQIVTTVDNASYFPSFETVTLSDRRAAWDDDLVHVRREMVAFNVKRMVSAFTGSGEAEEALEQEKKEPVEDGEALLLAEQARQARIAGDTAFFDTHASRAKLSRSFALELARFHFENDALSDAVEAIESLSDPEADLLRSEILFKQEEFEAAIEMARRVAESGNRSHRHWRVMLDAAVALEDRDKIVEIEELWHSFEPRREPLIDVFVARAFAMMGLPQEANTRAQRAYESQVELPFFATIDYAKILISLGKNTNAVKVLESTTVKKRWQAAQVAQVRASAERQDRGGASSAQVN